MVLCWRTRAGTWAGQCDYEVGADFHAVQYFGWDYEKGNMMGNKKPAVVALRIRHPADMKGGLKAIGGSMSDAWNEVIGGQVINSVLRAKNFDHDEASRLCSAAVEALIGIKPQDDIEGMIGAQLIACHNAAMECYRRAMLPDQSLEARHGNLNSANKLSRTYSTLLEALNRHRGKAQQKVTVEHVHVHAGGQAVVGNVEGGGGVTSRTVEQPHALSYAPRQTMPSTDSTGETEPAGAIGGKADMPSGR
jgi:hypothetical protein